MPQRLLQGIPERVGARLGTVPTSSSSPTSAPELGATPPRWPGLAGGDAPGTLDIAAGSADDVLVVELEDGKTLSAPFGLVSKAIACFITVSSEELLL